MKLTQDYRRMQANWGTDGDFITPEGKIIHTGDNHTIFMMKNPEIFNGIVDPGEIVGEGWIRTRGIGGTFSMDARGGITEIQLHVLQKMVRERCLYSDPRLEVAMNDGDVYQLTCDEFNELEYPNQIKRRGLRSANRMKMTRSYRLITSSFDTKLDFVRPLAESFHEGSGEYDAAFFVGNFEYTVIFHLIRTWNYHTDSFDIDSNNYEVSFKISDYKFSSDEEMVQILSKMAKRPLDLEEARMYLHNLPRYGITRLGNPLPVLSGVIDAIKRFVGVKHPSCLVFESYGSKRSELYHSMLHHLKKELGFDYVVKQVGIHKQFTLCMKQTG